MAATPLHPHPKFPLYYVGQGDFEDEAGRAVVQAIFDDNNDGDADVSPVLRFLFNAESYVEGFMRTAGYDIDALRTANPAEMQRLVLERAVGKAFVRHREIARYDGEEALNRNRNECKDYTRVGGPRLDVPKGLVDAPKNVGGAIGAIGNAPDSPPESFFSDLGDFTY